MDVGVWSFCSTRIVLSCLPGSNSSDFQNWFSYEDGSYLCGECDDGYGAYGRSLCGACDGVTSALGVVAIAGGGLVLFLALVITSACAGAFEVPCTACVCL